MVPLAVLLFPVLVQGVVFEPDFDNCGTGFGLDLLANFVSVTGEAASSRIVNGIPSAKPIPWLVYIKIILPRMRFLTIRMCRSTLTQYCESS